MEARASIKEIKISQRKVNLVAAMIRRRSTHEAIAILKFSQKRSRFFLIKLINSCISNAVNNLKMNGDQLFIKELLINEGRTAKRSRAQARGRSARILKRSSRAELVLCERVDLPTRRKTKKR